MRHQGDPLRPVGLRLIGIICCSVGFSLTYTEHGPAALYAVFLLGWAAVTATFHRLPVRYTPTIFKCPLQPWLPSAGALCCLHLIGSLGWPAYVRWVVWFLLGTAFYLCYGLHQSQGEGLARADSNSRESSMTSLVAAGAAAAGAGGRGSDGGGGAAAAAGGGVAGTGAGAPEAAERWLLLNALGGPSDRGNSLDRGTAGGVGGAAAAAAAAVSSSSSAAHAPVSFVPGGLHGQRGGGAKFGGEDLMVELSGMGPATAAAAAAENGHHGTVARAKKGATVAAAAGQVNGNGVARGPAGEVNGSGAAAVAAGAHLAGALAHRRTHTPTRVEGVGEGGPGVLQPEAEVVVVAPGGGVSAYAPAHAQQASHLAPVRTQSPAGGGTGGGAALRRSPSPRTSPSPHVGQQR